MEQVDASGVELPIALCLVCDREVLTYLGLEEDEPRRCVHCDTAVNEALLHGATVDDLDAAGYGEVAPAKSCGSGGCGSGGCGR